MRAVIYLFSFVLAVVVGQNTNVMNNLPKYDDRYDYLELDAILDSKRLIRNYVDCLVNLKPCTPEGKSLKRLLPEALRTKCVRCTERQKKTAVKVIKKLKYEYPVEWAKLSARWDPTGDFTRYFEEFLAKEQFNVISDSGNEITYPPASSPTNETPLTNPPADTSKPPVPVILNRFGDMDEEMPSSMVTTTTTQRPSTNPSTVTTVRPPISPIQWKPVVSPGRIPRPSDRKSELLLHDRNNQNGILTGLCPWFYHIHKPTQTTWVVAGSESVPTRYPTQPTDFNSYTTALTFIDEIGYKIIRTTELVTDILRNTVKAVVGV